MIRTFFLLFTPLLLIAAEPKENAAPLYEEAVKSIRPFTVEEKGHISAICGTKLNENAAPFPEAAARSLLTDFTAPLAQWEAATQISHCDWNDDPSQGAGINYQPRNIIPLVQIALARARLASFEGRPHDALADYRRILHSSQVIAEPHHSIISMLISSSVQNLLAHALSADFAYFEAKELRELGVLLEIRPSWPLLPITLTTEQAQLKATLALPTGFLPSSAARGNGIIERLRVWYLHRAEARKEKEIIASLKKAVAIYDQVAPLLTLPPAEAIPRVNAYYTDLEHQRLPKFVLDASKGFQRIPETYLTNDLRFDLIRTAIAIRLNGPEAVKESRDLFTGKPYLYEEKKDGFSLSSGFTYNEKPVRLFFPHRANHLPQP